MVAVEMAGRIIVATQLAVLQVRHLPDEVDGDVGTLTVHRLAPRPGAAGPGAGPGGGGGGGAEQDGEQEGERQHFSLYLLVRLSRATEDCLGEFSL